MIPSRSQFLHSCSPYPPFSPIPHVTVFKYSFCVSKYSVCVLMSPVLTVFVFIYDYFPVSVSQCGFVYLSIMCLCMSSSLGIYHVGLFVFMYVCAYVTSHSVYQHMYPSSLCPFGLDYQCDTMCVKLTTDQCQRLLYIFIY